MDFATWEPVYERILADFGFDREADERARDVLAEITRPFDRSGISFEGERIAVAGAGPSLEAEADAAAAADTVLAASTAADRLLASGVDVDYLVTDLDGSPERLGEMSERGIVVVVHAHGDNLAAVRAYVPPLTDRPVLPTTQARPVGPVENFGGFTDGDRAAFLADHFGAEELAFVGWDFDDGSISAAKRLKLRWAERLLYWLERRRDDRFPVLDVRRERIDSSVLPL